MFSSMGWVTCLFSCRRSEDLDDLDQLVHAAVTRKYRLPEHQLGEYASFKKEKTFNFDAFTNCTGIKLALE